MQDIRNIIFSNEELLSAFDAYARKTPDFMLPGKLISCTPKSSTENGSEVIVKVEQIFDGAPKIVETAYRGAGVLNPLILFCLENNIMLPRDGHKSFLVLDAQANLIIDLNLEFDLGIEEAHLTSDDLGPTN